MMKLGWILGVALLASAGPAFAQSACPSDGSCPVDVGACLAESCPCAPTTVETRGRTTAST